MCIFDFHGIQPPFRQCLGLGLTSLIYLHRILKKAVRYFVEYKPCFQSLRGHWFDRRQTRIPWIPTVNLSAPHAQQSTYLKSKVTAVPIWNLYQRVRTTLYVYGLASRDWGSHPAFPNSGDAKWIYYWLTISIVKAQRGFWCRGCFWRRYSVHTCHFHENGTQLLFSSVPAEAPGTLDHPLWGTVKSRTNPRRHSPG